MDFFNEYGLLIAVTLPGAVVMLLNVILAATGEHGTLLLPSLATKWPRVDAGIDVEETPAVAAPAPELPAEELLRKAA